MTLATIPVLQQLIDAFEWVLIRFHDLGAGWGLSIVLLTVVIRALLVPLTLRQFRSMQSLQRLQPEMKALQAKYKDDKQRLNQEMMAFYRENKVNPFGSCLPLLAQMPVFIGLFYMLRKDLRFNICPERQPPGTTAGHGHTMVCGPGHDHGFLFIPDLTNKATGAVLIALIVMYVGSQLASTLLMSVTADKTQRNLMLVLPLVFVTFILSFPAGLIVYWITTNCWTIVQQYIVRRRVGPMGPAAVAAAGAGAGGGGKALPGTAVAAVPGAKAKSSANGASSGSSGSPPPPPRKKKKRSGRRR
ncbi:MAG: YidC/Oxa1 family rane protein insertase [Solirubrobacteraceae bacterium]|jgi:YidC/Oxa1 family membrane protein insertase|nr:YidC/Oxa1 family rane protein insertase [Solirubrobacteraceae bacterium]